MRRMRRLTAILLALAMVLSLLPAATVSAEAADTYALDVRWFEGTGTVTTTEARYGAGDPVRLACVPAEGYRLLSAVFGRTEDGKVIIGDEADAVDGLTTAGITDKGSYWETAFTMPARDLTLWLNFIPETAERHTARISNSIQWSNKARATLRGGSETASFYEGEYVQLFEITDESRYIWYQALENLETYAPSDGRAFRMPSHDVDLSAFERNTHIVAAAVNDAARGTVTGGGYYQPNGPVTLTAAAKPGYTFVNWTRDGAEVGTEETYSFYAYESCTLQANFRDNGKTLLRVAPGVLNGGTVSVRDGRPPVMPGGYEYKPGDHVFLTFTPDEHCDFAGWAGDGVDPAHKTDTSITVVVADSDLTLTADVGRLWRGRGTEADPYLIENEGQLRLLAREVNGGNDFSGAYFRLTGGIDLHGTDDDWDNDIQVLPGAESWTPIGADSAHPFNGCFDGGGQSVWRLYADLSGNDVYAGLFGCVGPNGTVKNLLVTGRLDVAGGGNVLCAGLLAGKCEGTLEWCVVSPSGNKGGAVTVSNRAAECYVGGAVGLLAGAGSVFEECDDDSDTSYRDNVQHAAVTVENERRNAALSVGGAVGRSEGTLENCFFAWGHVTFRDRAGADSCVGGVVGDNAGAAMNLLPHGSALLAEGGGTCRAGGSVGRNTGSIESSIEHHAPYSCAVFVDGAQKAIVGGIVGENRGTVETALCLAPVGAEGGSVSAGGIVGRNAEGAAVRDCYSLSMVRADGSSHPVYVGGVAGENDGTLEDSYSADRVSGGAIGYIGGVVGRNGGETLRCYNIGEVAGGACAGGVAGDNAGTVENCYCYTHGTIEGNGLAGYNTGTVKNCYFYGEIEVSLDPVTSEQRFENIGMATGVAGAEGDGGTVEGCCYLAGSALVVTDAVSGVSGGARALTPDEFKDPASFAGWDIVTEKKTDSIDPSKFGYLPDAGHVWYVQFNYGVNEDGYPNYNGSYYERPLLSLFSLTGADDLFKYHNKDVAESFTADITDDAARTSCFILVEDEFLPGRPARHFFMGDEGEAYAIIAKKIGDADIPGLYTGGVSNASVDGSITGFPVIGIVLTAAIFEGGYSGCRNVEALTIPAYTARIGQRAFTDCPSLREFRVEDANPILHSPGGVLLSRDDKTLCAYPANKAGTSYAVPDAVRSICGGAFDGARYLETIDVGENVKSIGKNAFRGAAALRRIDVAAANTAYCSVDGVLFTKDMTTLVAYPAAKPGAAYTVPDSVKVIASGAFDSSRYLETLASGAFDSSRYLETLAIGKNVEEIGYDVFRGAKNLASVTVDADNPVYCSTDTAGKTLVAPPQDYALSVADGTVVSVDGVPFGTDNAVCREGSRIVIRAEVPSNRVLLGWTSDEIDFPAVARSPYELPPLEETFTMPAQDVDIAANFGVVFNVRWCNYDGSLIKSENILGGRNAIYNGETPTMDAPGGGSYAFTGWFPEPTVVTDFATYVAHFDENVVQYTLTFVDEDGTSVLQEAKYNAGTAAASVRPSVPSKPADEHYSYAFAGWEPALADVTANATYRAVYNRIPKQFTVTFLNDDGVSVLSSATYDCGTAEADVFPEDPVKPWTPQYAYSFLRWTPQLPDGVVAYNAAYTALYTETVRQYDVTWKDWDGTELQTDTLNYGETPEYTGETPTRPATAGERYTFTGWSDGVNTYAPGETLPIVEGSVTYQAQFVEAANTYEITFRNYDGTVLQSGEVPYGTTPAYSGETPQRPATAQYTYTFSGWTPAIVPVTGEATYTATYSATVNEYEIKFVNYDGAVLQSGSVPYGTTPKYSGETPTKPATAQYTYTFSGWTPAIVPVTGDAAYTAAYSTAVNEYEIKFVNYDGAVLQSGSVPYGATPEYSGETPQKPGTAQYSCVFTGWAPAIVPVTGSATYTAQFAEAVNEYSVTVRNGAGSGVYAVGATVRITANAAPAGMAFDRWVTNDGVTFANERDETTTFVMPAKNVTVMALYLSTSRGEEDHEGPAYPVVIVSSSGGSAIAVPAEPHLGDTVTVVVTADAGYAVASVTAVDANGGSVGIRRTGSGTYTFLQPGSCVTVTVTFRKLQTPTARVVLSPQRITVNGIVRAVEAYNIGGTNYFKLRDLAALLKGTPAQFNVSYDAARNAVIVTRGAPYDGEAESVFTDRSASAVASPQTVEIDGQAVSLTAYNIGGNNFFSLRELAALLGYSVDYDEASNTAVIESR